MYLLGHFGAFFNFLKSKTFLIQLGLALLVLVVTVFFVLRYLNSTTNHGEFVEVHEPISPEKAYFLTSHEQAPALELPEADGRGVKRAHVLRNKLRARMSVANAEAVPKVTANDLKEIEHH